MRAGREMKGLLLILRRVPGRIKGGLAASAVALHEPAWGLGPEGPLRFPGYSDRLVVLVVGLLLVGGFLILLNGLRRRADRRDK